MPTSVGELLILVVIGNCWFPSLDFWLLQMIPPSAFLWGALLLQLGPPLQVLYVVFISLVETKFFVDACIWDEFLVTAAVLERSTLASSSFCYDFRRVFSRCRALATAAVGASPGKW